MLSQKYLYASNSLKEKYLSNSIDYDAYLKFLEALKDQEIDHQGWITKGEKRSYEETIWTFEARQWVAIKEEQALREKEEHEQERRRIVDTKRLEKIQQEENWRNSLTPEQKLYEEREAFYKEKVPRLIEDYKGESRRYRVSYDRSQWFIIICSTVVTSTTGITIFTNTPTLSYTFKIIAAACSLVVSVATGLTGFFKYRERSTNLQKAADDIEHEYDAIKLGTHLYLNKSREEAMGIFASRVIARIKEQKEQQQILEQPPDAKQVNISN